MPIQCNKRAHDRVFCYVPSHFVHRSLLLEVVNAPIFLLQAVVLLFPVHFVSKSCALKLFQVFLDELNLLSTINLPDYRKAEQGIKLLFVIQGITWFMTSTRSLEPKLEIGRAHV